MENFENIMNVIDLLSVTQKPKRMENPVRIELPSHQWSDETGWLNIKTRRVSNILNKKNKHLYRSFIVNSLSDKNVEFNKISVVVTC